MRTNLYTIYDTIAEVFNKPFVEHNDQSAIRAFIDAAQKNNFAHKDDYALYAVGEYNDSTGTIIAYDLPKKIYTGFDIKVGDSITEEQQLEDLSKMDMLKKQSD